MVNWQDPTVIAYCAFIYNENAVFLLGFLGFYLFAHFDIEWSLIRRKRHFELILIPYLLGRYALFVTLLLFVLNNRYHFHLDCQVTYRFLALFGSSASSCSTLNLGIRSYIIWKDMNRPVVWVLAVGCFAHFSLGIIQAILSVDFTWDPLAGACVVVSSSNVTMSIFYVYTILMDLFILVLTFCGLWRSAALDSTIGSTLSEQCLWYCVGTFLCNIPAVVFPVMNLNVVTNVIASMPAATFSVVMSSSTVISLFRNSKRKHRGSLTGTSFTDEPPSGIIGVSVHNTTSNRVTFSTNIALGTRGSAEYDNDSAV